MTVPEENRPKTDNTDPVVMRPHPDRRLDEVAPLPEEERGEVNVERDGRLERLDPSEGTEGDGG